MNKARSPLLMLLMLLMPCDVLGCLSQDDPAADADGLDPDNPEASKPWLQRRASKVWAGLMGLALLAVLVGLLLQNLWVQEDSNYVGLHRCGCM